MSADRDRRGEVGCLCIRTKTVAVIGYASSPGALVSMRLKSVVLLHSALAAAAWKVLASGVTNCPARFRISAVLSLSWVACTYST